jgi:hypothetical protein
MKAIFNQRALGRPPSLLDASISRLRHSATSMPTGPALVKMVEDPEAPVPYAYMRTVILVIKSTPVLKSVVADEVVPRLVQKQVRLHANRRERGEVIVQELRTRGLWSLPDLDEAATGVGGAGPPAQARGRQGRHGQDVRGPALHTGAAAAGQRGR